MTPKLKKGLIHLAVGTAVLVPAATFVTFLLMGSLAGVEAVTWGHDPQQVIAAAKKYGAEWPVVSQRRSHKCEKLGETAELRTGLGWNKADASSVPGGAPPYLSYDSPSSKDFFLNVGGLTAYPREIRFKFPDLLDFRGGEAPVGPVCELAGDKGPVADFGRAVAAGEKVLTLVLAEGLAIPFKLLEDQGEPTYSAQLSAQEFATSYQGPLGAFVASQPAWSALSIAGQNNESVGFYHYKLPDSKELRIFWTVKPDTGAHLRTYLR